MKVHANAPLGPKGRLTMVRRVLEQGWSLDGGGRGRRSERAHLLEVGRALPRRGRGRAARTAPRRRGRSRTAPPERSGRGDRRAAPAADDRRRRSPSCLGMALSTVSAVLLRIGLGKLIRLEPPEPPNRYERRHAGELLHVDVKKLGRIAKAAPGTACTGNGAQPARQTRRGRPRPQAVGWEFVHVCVDDATRLAYVEVLADEKATTAVGFLRARSPSTPPRHHGRARDDRQRRLPTAPPSTPSPAARWASATCAPGPTGRAPTARPSASSARCSAGWAYGAIYGSSRERTAALDGWLWTYNHRRPHGSLSHKPPDRSPRRAEQPG